MKLLGGIVRGVCVVFGCCGASFVAASPAPAADWTAPIEVSPTGSATDAAQVAVDATGDVTLVWSAAAHPLSGAIKSTRLPAGGSWEATQTPIADTTCHNPSLAVAAGGAAVLVADCGSGPAKLKAAFRPAGGAWQSAVEIPESGEGELPHVAIDDSGNAIAVWEREDHTIVSSYRPAATGIWGARQPISATGKGNEAQVAMNPTGLAIVVWRNTEPTASTFAIRTKSRLPGAASTWVAEQALSATTASSEGYEPQIALNAEGRRAVWAEKVFGESRLILQSAEGSGCNSCTWTEMAGIPSVNDTTRQVEHPQVAIDAKGSATAVWRGLAIPDVSGLASVASASKAVTDPVWSSPVGISSEPVHVFATPARVSADSAGDATAAWIAEDHAVHLATKPAGHSFGPDQLASGALGGEELSDLGLAMDPGGDAFLAWTSNTGERRIGFTMRDGTPPVLSGLDVPVSGETGVALAMSVSAADTWSAPATVNWDFGDGTTGTGATVSHAYATPGTKTVTINATDAQGNTSASQTRQVVVTQGHGENRPQLQMTVTVPHQTWKAIAAAKAIRLRCGLDAPGTCSATATVGHGVGERLGIAPAKGAKPVQIGTGSTAVAAGGVVTLKVKLTAAARRAIAKAKKSVPVTLTVAGDAAGRRAATSVKRLKIKRP